RFSLPIPDDKVDDVPFYKPPEDSPEMKYMRSRIEAMGGSLPARRRKAVPLVPDESRTFGMEGMFRQLGIYSHVGQLYRPQDAEQLMYYKESKTGQVL